MKKTILIFAILLLFASHMKAQVKAGLTAGFNFADMNVMNNYVSVESDLLVSIHLGGAIRFDLAKYFALQSGLIFSGKGSKVQTIISNPAIGTGTLTQRLKPIYLEMPMDAVFKINAKDRKVLLFGGMYLGVGVGGKVENEVSGFSRLYNSDQILKIFDLANSTNVNYGTSSECNIRRFDYGLEVGLGTELGNTQLNLKYQIGFKNLDPEGKSENGITNRVFAINMVYLF